MPTVSPLYQQRGRPNPYYTMKGNIKQIVLKLVNDKEGAIIEEQVIQSMTERIAQAYERNKEFIKAGRGLPKQPSKNEVKQKARLEANKKKLTDIVFKCVDDVDGDIIYEPDRGTYLFQVCKASNGHVQLPYGIKVSKDKIQGHLGMTTRKDSTASSNVNELLSVYFLDNPDMEPQELERHCTTQSGSTGVLHGEGTPVTFAELADLIDKDATEKRDINIGRNNAIAIKKDIKGKIVATKYWVPRGKPTGISPKTPSDVILKFTDGTFLGYSNKIASGTDATPKFNTNLNAFYKKMDDGGQLSAVQGLMDSAWATAAGTVTATNAKAALDNFNIAGEPYSESGSTRSFSNIADSFRDDGLNFYAKDFYYPFRNSLITSFAKHLETSANLVYFLQTIYFYTYDDPRSSYTPCPYKLLVGNPSGSSKITNVSDNLELKGLLFNSDASKLSSISGSYDGTSQSFKMTFKYNKKTVSIPITMRTRTAGGWQGKSLYINTPGVKFL